MGTGNKGRGNREDGGADGPSQRHTPHVKHLALRLTGELWRFWYVRGHLSEGRAQVSRALAVAGGDAAARAKALNGAGNLACDQGDYAAAQALHEESVVMRRELGDRPCIAWSLGNLGILAESQGNHSAARSLQEESLAIRLELSDRPGIAYSLEGLATLAAAMGSHLHAISLWARRNACARRLGRR